MISLEAFLKLNVPFSRLWDVTSARNPMAASSAAVILQRRRWKSRSPTECATADGRDVVQDAEPVEWPPECF